MITARTVQGAGGVVKERRGLTRLASNRIDSRPDRLPLTRLGPGHLRYQIHVCHATLDDQEFEDLLKKLKAMQPPPSEDRSRLKKAIELIDAANSEDPTQVPWEGRNQPYRLIYSQWLTEWVQRLEPQASDAALILARGKNIEGWKLSQIKRDDYAPNAVGQRMWQQDRKKWLADRLFQVMREAGYPEASITLVAEILLEKDIPDPRDIRIYDLQGAFGMINFRLLEQAQIIQLLDDAEVMVFLEKNFKQLFNRLPADEVKEAVQREVVKLSERGIMQVLSMPWSKVERALLMKVLPAPKKFRSIMLKSEGRFAASTHPGDWRYQNFDYD